jgi:hypothetical protein
MLSFALAQKLKTAGYSSHISDDAEYFLNEHLMIKRRDAKHMWYADPSKHDWELKLPDELVYCPTLGELIEGCGLPFVLSCDTAGHWHAKGSLLGESQSADGHSPVEAAAGLWLVLHAKI